MKLHRFYTGPELELKTDFWLHEKALLNQWGRVLRFRPGQEVVLFDGRSHERLYKIEAINEREAHLVMITEFESKSPSRKIYLLFALLKKDKNEWVVQKGTEVGVSHFLPLLADRSEKTGFNLERAYKIAVEAAEQCGRSDIPSLREPMHTATAMEELKDKITLVVAEQELDPSPYTLDPSTPAGVLVGPEGGWSDEEKELFKKLNLGHLNLHDFTLRAETAAILAVSKLIG